MLIKAAMKKLFLYALAVLLSASAYGQKQRYYKVIYAKDTVFVDADGVRDYIRDEIDKTTHGEPKETAPKNFLIIPVYLTPDEFEKVDLYGC